MPVFNCNASYSTSSGVGLELEKQFEGTKAAMLKKIAWLMSNPHPDDPNSTLTSIRVSIVAWPESISE